MVVATRAVITVGNGRGFIIKAGNSRYIVTAAHCLPEDRVPTPLLANGTNELTFPNVAGRLKSKRQTIWAELCAFNLCDDLAVLSEPDNQELSEKYERYERFTARAMTLGNPPAIIETYRLRETPGTAARVLSLDGEWQSCTLHNNGRFLLIKESALIVAGMSGSPIIDINGDAIGLISTSTEGDVGDHFGYSINPSLADCLPPWLLRKMQGGETDYFENV